ncbi:cornichon, partial [Mycena olivaceomarginata]
GYLFLLAALIAAGLMFVHITYLIMFAEFEEHHINNMDMDLCNQLNKFVQTEHLAPAFLASVFLLSRNWMAFVLIVPLAAYNVKKRANFKNHLFDVGELKFRRVPWKHRKESFIKTGFYLLSFFFSIYSMIVALIADSQ